MTQKLPKKLHYKWSIADGVLRRERKFQVTIPACEMPISFLRCVVSSSEWPVWVFKGSDGAVWTQTYPAKSVDAVLRSYPDLDTAVAATLLGGGL